MNREGASTKWTRRRGLRRPKAGVKALTAAAVFGLVAFAGREARAFESQQHFGFGGGLALLKPQDVSLSAGAGGGFHYGYGINDSINFVAETQTSWIGISRDGSDTRALFASSLGAGVTYGFDVVQWVPYVGVLGAGYLLYGKALDHPIGAAGVQLALGIDYQVSRSMAVGLAVRQHIIVTKLEDFPSYTTAFLRAEYMWGW